MRNKATIVGVLLASFLAGCTGKETTPADIMPKQGRVVFSETASGPAVSQLAAGSELFVRYEAPGYGPSNPAIDMTLRRDGKPLYYLDVSDVSDEPRTTPAGRDAVSFGDLLMGPGPWKAKLPPGLRAGRYQLCGVVTYGYPYTPGPQPEDRFCLTIRAVST